MKDNIYHIYRTNEKPCIDLSNLDVGDFTANKEVMFRKPVRAKYVGRFEVHKCFYNAITSLYDNCNFRGAFDNKYALNQLDKHYHLIYSEIKYSSDLLQDEYYKNVV